MPVGLLVLAPITYPEALHSLLALTGCARVVMRSQAVDRRGCAWETSTRTEELDALLTGQRPMPDAGGPCGPCRFESVEVRGGRPYELAR